MPPTAPSPVPTPGPGTPPGTTSGPAAPAPATEALPSLPSALAANRYPGRGLLAARTGDGELVIVYFLTGRSPASQDRVLRREGEDLVVVPSGDHAFDPLRHYAAVTRGGDWLVVGNGDQVGQVAERLAHGQDLLTATEPVEFEPDPPLCTSRITMLVRAEHVHLHAARHARAGRDETDAMLVRLGSLRTGDGILLTTYESDGETVLTARPYVEVAVDAADVDALLAQVWDALDPALRVAAAAIAPSRTEWLAGQRAR